MVKRRERLCHAVDTIAFIDRISETFIEDPAALIASSIYMLLSAIKLEPNTIYAHNTHEQYLHAVSLCVENREILCHRRNDRRFYICSSSFEHAVVILRGRIIDRVSLTYYDNKGLLERRSGI